MLNDSAIFWWRYFWKLFRFSDAESTHRCGWWAVTIGDCHHLQCSIFWTFIWLNIQILPACKLNKLTPRLPARWAASNDLIGNIIWLNHLNYLFESFQCLRSECVECFFLYTLHNVLEFGSEKKCTINFKKSQEILWTLQTIWSMVNEHKNCVHRFSYRNSFRSIVRNSFVFHSCSTAMKRVITLIRSRFHSSVS